MHSFGGRVRVEAGRDAELPRMASRLESFDGLWLSPKKVGPHTGITARRRSAATLFTLVHGLA